MRIPKSIGPGDTIGLVAPSFGATTEPYRTRLEAAVRRFEARGYRVRAAESCYMDDGLGISTDPVKAAQDLTDFYLDDGIAALISVGGGELMNETISHVDFRRLAEAPAKWFMGYSDNTNMILPMALIADVAGIYAPCATSFGKEWTAPEEDAFAVLEGKKSLFRGYPLFELPDDETRSEDPLAPYHLTEDKVLRCYMPAASAPAEGRTGAAGAAALQVPSARAEAWFRQVGAEMPVRMEGTVLGGCLDILVNLCGTDYLPVPAFLKRSGPVIWALEACDLNVMGIRRALWHLRQMGYFDTAAGFVFGRPLMAFRQDFGGVDAYNAVTGPLAGLDVPIIMDADIGHVAPMMPLVIGAHAEVSASGNDLRIAVDLMPEKG